MQEYKSIVNTVELPTDDDISKCLRVVEYLPVASAALEGEAYFLKKAQEGYQITHSYICTYNEATATYYWKDMNMGRFGVGNVTDFRMAVSSTGDNSADYKITLCWKDPVDETVGTDVAVWDKTVCVVKVGSAPISIADGSKVLVNTERDSCASFGDFTFNLSTVPNVSLGNLEGKTVYIKLFPVTKDGVVTINDANCKSFKYGVDTMSWALARELIQNGHGPEYFNVGDVITLPYHGDFGELEVEVLGHDTETLADNTKRHSMTVATARLPGWFDGHDTGLVFDNFNTPYIGNETADGESVPHFEIANLPTTTTWKTRTDGFWNKAYGDAIKGGLKTRPTTNTPVLIGSVWDGNDDSVDVYGIVKRTALESEKGSYRVNVPFKTSLHVVADGKWGRKSNTTASGPRELPCAVLGSVIMPYSATFTPEYAFMREIIEYSYTNDTDLLTAVQNTFSGNNRTMDTGNSYAALFMSGCVTSGYTARTPDSGSNNLAFAIIPVDAVSESGGGASTTSRYFRSYKYLVPCNSVIVRSIDTSSKKVRQEYVTHFRNACADLYGIYEQLSNLRSNGTAANYSTAELPAYGHYRRYQTNVDATASSNKPGGLQNVNVLEIGKDLLHVPTRDEKYLPFKRYWKKTYVAGESASADLSNLAEYYEPGTGTDKYTNRHNRSVPYMYRVAKATNKRKAVYKRLFNKVYTITEVTSGSPSLDYTRSFFYTLTDDISVVSGRKYFSLVNGVYTKVTPESGDNPKNKGWYVMFNIAYTYVGQGNGSVALDIEVATGNWLSGTDYFEYIDGKFVQLRPKTEYSKIAYDYMITGTAAHQDTLTIDDQLYTANTYIEILNDTPRYDSGWKVGQDIAYSYTAQDVPDNKTNPTTAENLKIAFDSGHLHACVRVYGTPTSNTSTTGYDVAEICEAPVTSYVVSGDPQTNPGSVTNSGTIVNIFWQGCNAQRTKFGNPTWACSNLRMYLNGPFDTSTGSPVPVGYKCDPDDPERYWDYGVSPIQQYAYDYRLRKWVEAFDGSYVWFNDNVSVDPITGEKYADHLNSSYVGRYFGEGVAANPNPVMAGEVIRRSMADISSSDTRSGGVAADTTLPRQSFLHGFLDVKYKRTSDTYPVNGKRYYYRNALGRYESLEDSDSWVAGGPYKHALYELNENYQNDLLDALDFLGGITPVINRTTVYGKTAPVADGGFSEVYKYGGKAHPTKDLVWVASREQILGKGEATEWTEANEQLWIKSGSGHSWATKSVVRYGYHGENGYADWTGPGGSTASAGTRSPCHETSCDMLSVEWDNTGNYDVRVDTTDGGKLPINSHGFNFVMCIG